MRVGLYVFIFMFFWVASAQAQVTLDVSKITCDQWVHGKVAGPRIVGAWLNGFYHGKNNKVLIDMRAFRTNLNKVQKFCYDRKNFDVPVMEAFEQVLGK